jgi:hypothetical protein
MTHNLALRQEQRISRHSTASQNVETLRSSSFGLTFQDAVAWSVTATGLLPAFPCRHTIRLEAYTSRSSRKGALISAIVTSTSEVRTDVSPYKWQQIR